MHAPTHMWQCICLVSYVSLRQQIPTKTQPSVLGHENALLNNIENISLLIAQSHLYAHFPAEKKKMSSPLCTTMLSTQ